MSVLYKSGGWRSERIREWHSRAGIQVLQVAGALAAVPWPATPAAATVVEVAGPGGSSLRENWKLTVASVAAAFHLPAP